MRAAGAFLPSGFSFFSCSRATRLGNNTWRCFSFVLERAWHAAVPKDHSSPSVDFQAQGGVQESSHLKEKLESQACSVSPRNPLSMFPCWLYPSLFLLPAFPSWKDHWAQEGWKEGSSLHWDSFQALKILLFCNPARAQEL